MYTIIRWSLYTKYFIFFSFVSLNHYAWELHWWHVLLLYQRRWIPQRPPSHQRQRVQIGVDCRLPHLLARWLLQRHHSLVYIANDNNHNNYGTLLDLGLLSPNLCPPIVMRAQLRARTMKHLKGLWPETDLNRPNTVMKTQLRARTMKHLKGPWLEAD